ncbi:MAG: hypothetical protein HOQ24_19300 [Mycobacteriaceae bacterium]|nr:hypothetical protein [Mycobacteriaceae bacterium]
MNFSDEERDALRDAAFGALALVCAADPGVLAAMREEQAGVAVFATAPRELAVLLTGGMPLLPKGDPAAAEAAVLARLTAAGVLLRAKAPHWVQPYRNAVEEACLRAAQASNGTSDTEAAAIDKVRQALAR